MNFEKPICLVLTCNRDYYIARRTANHATFKLLADAGFHVLFLLADPSLEETTFGVDADTGYNTITVPCLESYDYLTYKMQLAYTALQHTSGVLKIDDDIRIPAPSCLAELRKIVSDADYFGIAQVLKSPGSGLPVQAGTRFSPIFKYLSASIHKSFTYFGGPFYWVSTSILKKIASEPLEYPWEDLAVGHLVSKYPGFKIKHLPWNSEKKITWNNDTEPVLPAAQPTSSLGIGMCGRLGNHMFQLAALLRHSLIHKKDIKIDVNGHSSYYDGSLYKFKKCITTSSIPNHAHTVPFHYIPISRTTRTLTGYFQSSKYFSDISDNIRALFTPHPDIVGAVDAKYGSYITDTNTVIIHVRRGDYMSTPNYHGILTPLYYRAGMSLFRAKLGPDTKFLILSDDIEYCRSTYGSDAGVTCINEPNESVTMHFMSQFQNYIISNSSFSWWATYLGKPATLVVAPDRWFGSAGPQDYQDIYEPEWIRITAQ